MKNTFFCKITFAIFILLAVLGCSNNQNAKKKTTSFMVNKTDTTNHLDDSIFFIKAAEINLEEMQLGELAQQKTKAQDIKKLGEMMQEDHRNSMNSLTVLAKKKSIEIPTSLDRAAQADYEKLNSKSGTNFDKMYADMMVQGHKGAIALFEKDSIKFNDSDIRQWIISTLPTLRKHLAHSIICQMAFNKVK